MTRRFWNSRQQLEDAGLSLKINTEGGYDFYYNDVKKSVINIPCKHAYGKTVEYPAIAIYIGDKITSRNGKEYYNQRFILLHVFVWLWFNNSIPAGYDVDHIDNNKMNCNINNLQLLTRKENLQKRGPGRNQYSAKLTDDEILKLRAEKQKKIDDAIERKKIRNTYKQTVARLEEEINDIKVELETTINRRLKAKKNMIKCMNQKKKAARTFYEEELLRLLNK